MSGFSPYGRQLPDSLNNLTSLLSQNYTLKGVNLKGGPVPSSLNSLVVVRPTEKFSDYELYLLDQALMRGTNLILFLDAFKESRNPKQNMAFSQGPPFMPFDSGLEKLLEHYGVRIRKSIVLDENSHKQQLPQTMGGGEQYIYFAPIIKKENINHDLPFMKDINGLVALKVSPLELNDKGLSENNITAHKLFSSSSKSWEMREPIMLNPMFMKPPSAKEKQKSMALAYLLEGEFKSYFAGKPIPEKEAEKEKPGADKEQPLDKGLDSPEAEAKKREPALQKVEGKGGFIAKGMAARIFLLASSDILRDNILSPEGDSLNDMFVMNVVDAMNGRDDIAAMRSKVLEFNPISETGSAVKAFIKAFNVGGLPILVVLFGLFVMMRRHSRKKRIQIIFQKQ
jgi:ABC-type uncharacterized transport system involved in gliding motility auxiliary subunit